MDLQRKPHTHLHNDTVFSCCLDTRARASSLPIRIDPSVGHGQEPLFAYTAGDTHTYTHSLEKTRSAHARTVLVSASVLVTLWRPPISIEIWSYFCSNSWLRFLKNCFSNFSFVKVWQKHPFSRFLKKPAITFGSVVCRFVCLGNCVCRCFVPFLENSTKPL